MINDEYTDDNLVVEPRISMSDVRPVGHSATPMIATFSRVKYRDANWMP